MTRLSGLASIGILAVLVGAGDAVADAVTPVPLTETTGLELINVDARAVRFRERDGLEVTISAEARAALAAERASRGAAEASAPPPRSDHLVVVPGAFADGSIEVELAGAPAPGAPGEARGFVGVAFRVQDDRSSYECFYLRPSNGRAEDQERRNHATQYVSHPDFTWHRLRAETPSRYEAYVDIVPGEWIPIRIDVEGATARLFVHGQTQPTLIVNDLKLGAARGAVALWIEGSTIAHFRNLRITHADPRTNSGENP